MKQSSSGSNSQVLEIFGVDVLWSGHSSCLDKCGTFSMDGLQCQCDRFCLRRGDCCLDYELACDAELHEERKGQWFQHLQTNVHKIEGHLKHRLLIQEILECKMIELYYSIKKVVKEKHVNVITNCSITVDNRCYNNSGKDILEITPVCDDTFIYSNIYCAMCTGVQKEDILALIPQFTCTQQVEKEAMDIRFNKGEDAFISFVLTMCHISFQAWKMYKCHKREVPV